MVENVRTTTLKDFLPVFKTVGMVVGGLAGGWQVTRRWRGEGRESHHGGSSTEGRGAVVLPRAGVPGRVPVQAPPHQERDGAW